MAILRLLKDALWKFFEDDAVTLAASVAFFTALSLSPLLVILIGAVGIFGDQILTHLIDEITTLVGPTASATIEMVVRNVAERKTASGLTAVIGIVTLFFFATGVFVQLKKSINRLWGIETKPGREIHGFFQKRLISLGMLLVIGFLLLASLAVSTVIDVTISREGWLWYVVNHGTSLIIYYLLFGLILRYLPDANVRWRDAAVGAAITAVLFDLGKFLIGRYLSSRGIGSAYGAAGSLLILLLWTYYSSLIIFYGTEIAVLYTERFGGKIKPNSIARWIDPLCRAKQE